jgi:hypothetical protein
MYCWPPLPLIYIEEGESHFTILILYHDLSCVWDVTKMSAPMFLSLVHLHLYFISIILEVLWFLRDFGSS